MLRCMLMIGFISLTTCLCFANDSTSRGGYHHADLPPLLQFLDGNSVRTHEDWLRRASEIRELMCKYFIGTYPATAPAIRESKVVSEKQVDGITRRRIELIYNTPNKASCLIEIWLPKGNGPHPVFMTQPSGDQMHWAEKAHARGYLVCLYSGLDCNDNQPEYTGFGKRWPEFRAAYPDATWTEISGLAWMASRALDYVLDPTSGYNIEKRQVAIIGHSRYGKQVLIAAAFDPRFTSVVAVSPGSPGTCAYRFASRDSFMETPADFVGEWFLASLKSFAGREDELPIDAHAWLALIAPRKCMIDTAHNDQCESTFAVERSYLEAQKVYELLGHKENLHLNYRPGPHYPLTDARRNEDMDWFDYSFGRGSTARSFPEVLLHHFDWEAWKSKQSKKELKSPPANADKRAKILWSLGEAPAIREDWKNREFYTDEESKLLLHDRRPAEHTVRVPICFGDGVRGNAYFNPNIKGPMPVVIWLHPYCYSMGYVEIYGAKGATMCNQLAEKGYLVIAFDQLGFGSRLLEGKAFDAKYPKWSRLGRMVRDVSAAVDFAANNEGKSKSALPGAIKDQIYVLGYSLGGMVGLYAAALDDRISGVASFSGFTPMRTDTDDKNTGGIRRLWQWHALQPILGLYQGREKDIPFDYDDILSCISPRQCLIVSPKRDRMADLADVTACVDAARQSWTAKGAEANLTHLSPDGYNRFQSGEQAMFLDWITKLAQPAR